MIWSLLKDCVNGVKQLHSIQHVMGGPYFMFISISFALVAITDQVDHQVAAANANPEICRWLISQGLSGAVCGGGRRAGYDAGT